MLDSDDGEQPLTHSSPSLPSHSTIEQPNTPLSSSSSTSSPSVRHASLTEHQPVPATDVLTFTDPFPLSSLRSVASSPSLLPPPSTSTITSSTITLPSLSHTGSPGMLHSKPTSAVPHPRTKSQLSSSHPHLPFTTMGPQSTFTSPPPHPLPPSLQQQQYVQQYQTTQGNTPAPSATGGYEMMAHPLPITSYSSGHSSISHTAPPSSTLSHPFPLSTSTTLTYASLPTDPSVAGGVVGRSGLLPHVAAVPNFPTFSVPLAHTTTSSSSSTLPTASNLSLFPPVPAVYPYTPFMSLSTMPQLSGQMNPSFGASIPGQPNPVAGYPYLPPSLYTSTAQAPACTAVARKPL